MLMGELKAKCISELQAYAKGFQEWRPKVTEDVIDECMKVRPIDWKANPNPKRPQVEQESKPGEAADKAPKLTKDQGEEASKAKDD